MNSIGSRWLYSLKADDGELIQYVDTSDTENFCITVQTIGSFEEMLAWRTKYLQWLDSVALCANFRVGQRQASRTWYLDFYFEDKRDALLFKLTWS